MKYFRAIRVHTCTYMPVVQNRPCVREWAANGSIGNLQTCTGSHTPRLGSKITCMVRVVCAGLLPVLRFLAQ